MTTSPPLPLSLIGGFLGSGKTTLINRLLAGGHGRRLAIVVNDFGAIDIDARLIASHDGRTIALSNGCICCSIGGNLASTLLALRRDTQPPDHVIIEASGVSDPWKIAQIGLAGTAFTLLGITIVADAAEIQRQADDFHVGDTVRRQLRCADLLVLNKCDLASPPSRPALRRWLAKTAPHARIVETNFGAVGHTLLLDPAVDGRAARAELGQPAAADWMHLEGLARWTVELAGDFERVRLEAILNDAPDGVLRAKGFVCLREEGTHVMQMVGRRWSLSPAPEAAAASAVAALVVIGHAGADTAAPVEAWLARLTADDSECRRTSIGRREFRTEGAIAEPTVVESERDTAA